MNAPSLQHQRERPQMNTETFIILGIFVVTAFGIKPGDPIVETKAGKLEGTLLDINEGYMAEAFLGVPFAEPPIDDLRFEMTKPVKPWEGIREAKQTPPACIQIDRELPDLNAGEDCLYLNIARPKGTKPGDKLPVLLTIHGGAFEIGFAYLNFATFGNRVEQFLRDGIIVVSIQYRLGVYGFATTGTDVLPGNLGYWDQHAALTFVYENIEAFGGDPKRIIVGGHSAGGASASTLAIAPKTRDMVAGVIAMSGSPGAAWATSDDPIEWTNKLIKEFGIKDDESVKDRLKRASPNDINSALEKIGTTKWGVNFGSFTPRQDGTFFPTGNFREIIRNVPPKPILTGIASEESLLWTLVKTKNFSVGVLSIEQDRIDNFGESDFDDLLVKLIKKENYREHTEEVRGKVKEFYMKGNEKRNNIFYLQRYTQVFSDLQFNSPVLYDALYRALEDWPVYLYLATHVNKECFPKSCQVYASFHDSDQHYLTCDGVTKLDDPDGEIVEKFTINAWSAFIRSGDPTTKDLKWYPSARQRLHHAAIIDPKNIRMERLGKPLDSLRFWMDIKEQYGYDMIRQWGPNGATSFPPILGMILGLTLMKFLII